MANIDPLKFTHVVGADVLLRIDGSTQLIHAGRIDYPVDLVIFAGRPTPPEGHRDLDGVEVLHREPQVDERPMSEGVPIAVGVPQFVDAEPVMDHDEAARTWVASLDSEQLNSADSRLRRLAYTTDWEKAKMAAIEMWRRDEIKSADELAHLAHDIDLTPDERDPEVMREQAEAQDVFDQLTEAGKRTRLSKLRQGEGELDGPYEEHLLRLLEEWGNTELPTEQQLADVRDILAEANRPASDLGAKADDGGPAHTPPLFDDRTTYPASDVERGNISHDPNKIEMPPEYAETQSRYQQAAKRWIAPEPITVEETARRVWERASDLGKRLVRSQLDEFMHLKLKATPFQAELSKLAAPHVPDWGAVAEWRATAVEQ